ncbi:MAG: SDR family oxidoreductase [Pseudomonadales bacterium]|nr:SDR family oxidoreductase [Pseudomonadales bacterium]MCP5183379.1 SDR family oxidoreductase [Pseudomonadales bacterium]
MQLTLSGRTAIITGGSLGLGQAMAQAFYQAGARVAIVARRENVLAETKAAIAATEAPIGARIEAFACDVADGGALSRMHDAVVATLGPVDIVVNNAGKAVAKPFEKLTDQDWQDDLDLKLMAAVRLTRLVWPGMVARRWGRVINILNTFAKAPGANTSPTSVTRAAGMALTKVLAGEGAPHNVLVNALLIGLIRSDQIRRQWERSGANQDLETFVAEFGKRLPMGRMGEAGECASTALFLASEAASYVTGCAINMDGGMCPVV